MTVSQQVETQRTTTTRRERHEREIKKREKKLKRKKRGELMKPLRVFDGCFVHWFDRCKRSLKNKQATH
jgi:hypothetical protein